MKQWSILSLATLAAIVLFYAWPAKSASLNTQIISASLNTQIKSASLNTQITSAPLPTQSAPPNPIGSPHPPLEFFHLTGDFYIYVTWQPVDGEPYPANAMYLLTADGIVLFDTPWDSTQFQPLLDSLESRHHKKVVYCISTHWHSDRTAGLNYFRQKGIATWSTRQTKELCIQENKPAAEHTFENDTTFTIGDHSFRAFCPGEGHTKDNIVLWCKKEKILYGGCFIKSSAAEDIGYVGDANLKAYPASIKRVMQECPNPKYIIPGHLSWAGTKSLQHTLDMLEKSPKKK